MGRPWFQRGIRKKSGKQIVDWMTLNRRDPKASRAEHGVTAIENHQRVVRVQMRPLELFLQRVKNELGLRGDCVAVRLIRDGEMAWLNGKYRGIKRTTDVLSFPDEEKRKSGLRGNRRRKHRGAFLGDIAISPVLARRNARALGRQLLEELQVLILHGVLHLLGYDHEADRGEMERVEMRLRRRLGIG
jgi:probable rRNA maturation factor